MLKVFGTYYPIRNLLFFLAEGGLIILSLWIGLLFLPEAEGLLEKEKVGTGIRIVLTALIIQSTLYYHGLYEFRNPSRLSELSIHILQAVGVSFLILAGFYYVFPSMDLEQGIFFLGIFFLLLFLVSWRLIYQLACQKRLWNEQIILLGEGKLSRLIGQEIQSNLDSGYTVRAVFSNPGGSGLAQELEAEQYNSYDRLCEYALQKGIGKVIVALEERRGKSPVRHLVNCKMQGIKILEGNAFYEMISGKIPASSITPSGLVFSEGFSRTRITCWNKRILDLIFSLLGLVLGFPLLLVAALLIKVTSRGQVFFWQQRVGQMERHFQMIKFRTMREDAESQSGAVWAEKDDPRITAVGRVLRRLRLDELPQLWNVLKGEMSFVGPRPERPEFVEQLKQRLPFYGDRHTVKPGITGWAQINYGYGASEEDALRKLEYDLFYIKNLSLLFDLYIVLKTVKTVLAGGGAR